MPPDAAFWLPVLSLVVAGLAVFFGPMVQLAIARHQAKVTTHSINRQNWINHLREQLAIFVTNAADLMANSAAQIYGQTELTTKTIEMHLAMSRIRLMINPEESDHQKLIELLFKVSNVANSSTDKDNNLITEIINTSQSILKREWERVKVLD